MHSISEYDAKFDEVFNLKAKFKFLCDTFPACADVKRNLEEMGFKNFKDMPNSPSYDLSATFELENEEEREKIAKKILEKCKEKVQTIEVTI